MNTWHVDFSRPDWLCPACTWATGGHDGPEGPELLQACELHAGRSPRSSA